MPTRMEVAIGPCHFGKPGKRGFTGGLGCIGLGGDRERSEGAIEWVNLCKLSTGQQKLWL